MVLGRTSALQEEHFESMLFMSATLNHLRTLLYMSIRFRPQGYTLRPWGKNSTGWFQTPHIHHQSFPSRLNKTTLLTCTHLTSWQIKLCLCLPSGPPSAPENPISTVNETCVTLEWSPPRDTGGRGDITYSLHCRKCSGDSRKCTPCGSSVHFVPRQFGLSSATVLVTDLQPDSNYSFTVESQNGVSDLSPTPRGTVVINVTTSQTGGSIHALWE